MFSSLIPEASARKGGDIIHTLNAQAKARARKGENILNGTLGSLLDDDGNLAVIQAWERARTTIDPRLMAAYAPIQGHRGFLDGVAKELFGGNAHKTASVATPGACGGIFLTFKNFLEPGQSALLPHIHWPPYGVLSANAGRGLACFNTFKGSRFDLEAFREALWGQIASQGRAMPILNFPCNNPTGYSLDKEEWEGVAEILAQASQKGPVALLLDLAYEAYGPEGSRDWVKVIPQMGETTVVAVWTASKTFTRYGDRVGAVVALPPNPQEKEGMERAFSYTCRGTWSMSGHAGQMLTYKLMTDPVLKAEADRQRERLRDLLFERAELFNGEARRLGLDYPRYDGGFFVMVFCKEPNQVAEKMRKEGVFVVPIEGGVRLGICSVPAVDIPRLVQAVGRAL
ncbi:aminotransferase class I/II-fold pyridoxal phosphate-dependent enzyme [bacterium]|nr:aminotransferase class I/II-fold pyridoxal phosphate-dependent enzyme [bacterium]